METKIYFTNSNGDKLCGILSIPDTQIITPIIILCHGLNGKKDCNTNLALTKALIPKNIATFRFDFFAHEESEGKIEDRTIEKFVSDILGAVKFLKDKNYTQIGIMGASLGGMSAVIAASKTSDIKLLALKSTGMGPTSRKMPNYKHNFDNRTWIKVAKDIYIPTIIIHGTKDEQIEIELAIELAKAIKNSKLELLENADHRFTKKEDFDKSIEMILKFIIENINN